MSDPVTKAARVTKAIDKMADAQRAIDKAADAQRALDKVADAQRAVDKAADAQRAIDKVADAQRAVDKAADAQRAIDKAADAQRAVDKAADAQRAVDKAADAQRAVDKAADAGRSVKAADKAVDVSNFATKADVTDLALYGRWFRHAKSYGRSASWANPLKGPAHMIAEAWRFKGMTALSFLAAHYVTDGKSSIAVGNLLVSAAHVTADQIQDMWPEAAEFLRDSGPWLAQQGANLWALPKDAAITTGDAALIKQFGEEGSKAQRIALRFAVGAPDKAVLLELGYDDKITSADIAKIAYDASQRPESERKEYFINEFARQVGQTPEEVRTNFETHKNKLAFIPGFSEVMPEVKTAWEQFKQNHPESAAAMDNALAEAKKKTGTAMDAAGNVFRNTKPDLDDMGKQSLSSLFNLASDNLDTLGVGLIGKIVFHGLGLLSHIFGASTQKWALKFINIEEKFDKLVEAGKGNQLVAAVGNQFAPGNPATQDAGREQQNDAATPGHTGTAKHFSNAANGQQESGPHGAVPESHKLPVPPVLVASL